MQSDINLLILDEPTNHLDIDTREVLEEALTDFDGTLLFISHDRYFLNKLADELFCLEGGRLVNYCGNYDYYHEKTSKASVINVEDKTKNHEKDKGKKLIGTQQTSQIHVLETQKNLEIESEIVELESEIKHLKDSMNDPIHHSDYNFLQQIQSDIEERELHVEQLFQKWNGLGQLLVKYR